MIPTYVKNKSKDVQEKWQSIKSSYGGAVGLAVANKWLSCQTTTCVDNVCFTTPKENIISRSIDGVNYVDFMLADNRYDNYGTKYTDELLQQLANFINKNPSKIQGDFNHELLNNLTKEGAGKNYIKEKLNSLKSGVAKVVKAIYEKGKLYLRTIVNPKYVRRVINSKGVSIEGSFVREGNTFVDGTILGFSFIDDKQKDLGNPRAKILK